MFSYRVIPSNPLQNNKNAPFWWIDDSLLCESRESQHHLLVALSPGFEKSYGSAVSGKIDEMVSSCEGHANSFILRCYVIPAKASPPRDMPHVGGGGVECVCI